MRDEQGAAARLAELFYEGVLRKEAWREALTQFAQHMGSDRAMVVVRDKATQHVEADEHFNDSPAIMRDYNERFHEIDPAIAHVNRLAPGGWYHDRRDLGEAAMSESPFYQDFLHRHGIASVAANRLVDAGANDAFLSLHRGPHLRPFTQQELDAAAPIIPHVQRALRIRSRMRELAVRGGICEGALHMLRTPLVVADEDGRVVLANAEAEVFMGRRKELSMKDGRLVLQGAGAEGRLEPLLKAACGALGPAMAGGLRAGPRQREVTVVITPLPPRAAAGLAQSRPLAIVLLHDALLVPAGGEALLQELYRLTPAEARVTLGLARGLVPAKIAGELGTSLATVRTQMKAIFLKTGTARQADLVRAVQAVLAVAGS